MADESTTTGTPEPETGDAAEQTPTAESPSAEDRDASSTGTKEPDYKQLYLASKDKIEAANRLLEEQQRATHTPAAPAREPDEEEGFWAEVEEFARKGDPVAKAQLWNRDHQLRKEREIVDAFQLREIADADERKAVAQHYVRNRHRLGDVAAARAELRAGKLEEENQRLQAALKAAQQSSVRDPQVARTTLGREVTAKEHKTEKMTRAEWDQAQQRLEDEGKYAEKIAMQMRRRKGEIEIP
jgi:hypothetical protein